MLQKLYIRNYALISEAEIRFGKGLNILTGETGAGKSLLLGAIGLLLGNRADRSMIFNQDEKCIAEATFDSLPEEVLTPIRQLDLFDIEGNQLIFRREINANGRSRQFINDTPVQLSDMKDVAGMLVDLHGQHENQQLLAQGQQIRLLDAYAGNQFLLDEYRRARKTWQKNLEQLELLRQKEKEALQQQDYIRFQLEELEKAELDPQTFAQEEDELNLLQHAEDIRQSLEKAEFTLYDEDASAFTRLTEIIGELESFEGKISSIQAPLEMLRDAEVKLQEAVYEFRRIRDQVDADPEQLNLLEEKINAVNKLKMKFNAQDVEELVRIRDEFRNQLGEFESVTDDIRRLEKEISQAENALKDLAEGLSKCRKQAAPELEAKVNQLLQEVGLQDAGFMIEIAHEDGWKANGTDKVRFMVRTNKGVPAGPLSQAASGGEISRIMLAIKTALAGRVALPVMIFDEIDTGISGETAKKVGRVMKQIAQDCQVMAITHLPQIAGRGDRHFRIYKTSTENQTQTGVEALEEKARVMEIAGMLSGEDPSESAILNAEELIRNQ